MNRDIIELVSSKENFKEFLTNVIDKDTLISLSGNISTINPKYNKYKQSLLFLAYQEDITLKEAVSRLRDISIRPTLLSGGTEGTIHPWLSLDNVDKYISYYLTAKVPTKNKKLSELYNICLYVGNNSKYFSYQGINNLDEEVIRVIDVMYKLNPTMYSFANNMEILRENLPIGDSPAKEFICINGVKPRMFTTSRIAYYSALLNYPYSTLNKYIAYNYKIIDYIKDLSGITDNKFYNESSWDVKREFFKGMLDELSRRTINYSKDIIEEAIYGTEQ